MKCGIIGLPQAGKTSLFRILTRRLAQETHHHGEAEHVGVASVPDERLDRLAEIFHPVKTTPATVEFVDVAAIGQETLKETVYLANLRQVDGLVHVVRLFADETVPHTKGSVDPQRDITSVELDLLISDLAVVENRLARLAKDRVKIKSPELEHEHALLEKARAWLETGKPLREAEWSEQERKRLRGFAFLSEKPLLLVLNVGEEQAVQMNDLLSAPEFEPLRHRPRTWTAAVSGKIEAEMALLSDAEAAEFLQSYGLAEPGTPRVLRAALELLGLIVFFTVGEKECRAWTLPQGSTAAQAAGVIHTDLEKHFIRAEVVPWDKLLEAGTLADARQKGTLRLEGKDYIVRDGEIVHIRHSG